LATVFESIFKDYPKAFSADNYHTANTESHLLRPESWKYTSKKEPAKRGLLGVSFWVFGIP
jgi:hypothetical protein